jgi:hypothetical protein
MIRAWHLLGLILVLLTTGPALAEDEGPGTTTAYVLDGGEGLLQRFAPVFIIEHDEESFNKIGTPSARLSAGGKAEVFVDPAHATIYTSMEPFETARGHYTNLIYRIHFERNPFTLMPLNVGAGKNVGAIAVVTLNSNDEPVWVTTVQSCGCYHAIMPTDFLTQEAYPAAWNPEGFDVYGEHLPGLLKFKDSPADSRLAISIRGGSHRCKGVAVERASTLSGGVSVVTATAADMETLKALPLPDGAETSFYHTEGRRKGLVKGAHKPLETALFGLWAWDHNVGQDREYGPKEEAGRRFYTTLFFKHKKESDMWHFARYLEHNGWKP